MRHDRTPNLVLLEEPARSADPLQHTSPGAAIADLQSVAIQLERARLVTIGKLRRQASLDMMSHYIPLCVHCVRPEVCDIGSVSGEGMLG